MAVVPRGGAEVDLAWISNALRCGGVPGAEHLVAVSRQPLGAGAGAFGELTRLQLTYDKACPGAPSSIVVKLASSHAANRARAKVFGLYEREVRFYKAGGLGFPAPYCFGSTIDLGDDRFALILEDLSDLRQPDQLEGLRSETAIEVVEAVASAQARWWDSPDLDALGWVPLQSDLSLATAYIELWPAFLELHGSALPQGSTELGERVRDQFDALLDMTSRPPLTIVHGDLRADNVMVGPHGIVLIDWQMCSRCRGVFDVAYLLTQSMTVEQRRCQEVTVLRRWHDALIRAGVGGYSFSDAGVDYRLCVLICLGCAVVGAALRRDSDRGRTLARAQAVRVFAAAADLVHDGAYPC